MDNSIKERFRDLIIANEIEGVKGNLRQFPSLANMDLRKKEDQDQFTGSLPLAEAAKAGHNEIAQILLDHNADPNAEGTQKEDSPEYGLPICFAVEQKNYPLAHLLLDHNASVNAFPYCDKSMVEVVYEQARKAGLQKKFIKVGLQRYFGKITVAPLDQDSAEPIKLLHRIIALGGELPIGVLIRDEQIEIVEELLLHHADRETTPLTYPRGKIFEKICRSSSWYGIPEMLKKCIALRPALYTKTHAIGSIKSAIESHNRDGSIDDYLDIFKLNLDHLQSIGEFDPLITREPIYPIYRLAKDFAWHDNYGYRAALFGGEDIIRAAKLFRDYGFNDHDAPFPEDGLTALQIAETRKHHPCIPDFIIYLKSL